MTVPWVVDDLPSPGRHLPDGCSAGEALILAQQVRQEVGVQRQLTALELARLPGVVIVPGVPLLEN